MSNGLVSLDTNVIVRFLVNDDPVQASRASALIATHPIFITDTVLLETEWVLRGAYGKTQVEILGCFRALLGLPGVVVRDPSAIA
ncbi:MAG: type II toxin-antitoxin system VapC family toxin [Nevskia sp.]|nr:type II toxin-antitoxin system VapC family toxin [Nevskia sp.]